MSVNESFCCRFCIFLMLIESCINLVVMLRWVLFLGGIDVCVMIDGILIRFLILLSDFVSVNRWYFLSICFVVGLLFFRWIFKILLKLFIWNFVSVCWGWFFNLGYIIFLMVGWVFSYLVKVCVFL